MGSSKSKGAHCLSHGDSNKGHSGSKNIEKVPEVEEIVRKMTGDFKNDRRV